MAELTIKADSAGELKELLAALFPSGLNDIKELIMSASDDLKRELSENKAVTGAVVEALNLLRTTVADLKAMLESSKGGLSAAETAEAAASIDADQKAVQAALEAGGITAPTDPGAPIPEPDTGGTGPDSAVR